MSRGGVGGCSPSGLDAASALRPGLKLSCLSGPRGRGLSLGALFSSGLGDVRGAVGLHGSEIGVGGLGTVGIDRGGGGNAGAREEEGEKEWECLRCLYRLWDEDL